MCFRISEIRVNRSQRVLNMKIVKGKKIYAADEILSSKQFQFANKMLAIRVSHQISQEKAAMMVGIPLEEYGKMECSYMGFEVAKYEISTNKLEQAISKLESNNYEDATEDSTEKYNEANFYKYSVIFPFNYDNSNSLYDLRTGISKHCGVAENFSGALSQLSTSDDENIHEQTNIRNFQSEGPTENEVRSYAASI